MHLRYFKKEMQFFKWSDVQYATTASVQRWVTDYAINGGRNEAGIEQWFYCEKRRKIKRVLDLYLRSEQWREARKVKNY